MQRVAININDKTFNDFSELRDIFLNFYGIQTECLQIEEHTFMITAMRNIDTKSTPPETLAKIFNIVIENYMKDVEINAENIGLILFILCRDIHLHSKWFESIGLNLYAASKQSFKTKIITMANSYVNLSNTSNESSDLLNHLRFISSEIKNITPQEQHILIDILENFYNIKGEVQNSEFNYDNFFLDLRKILIFYNFSYYLSKFNKDKKYKISFILNKITNNKLKILIDNNMINFKEFFSLIDKIAEDGDLRLISIRHDDLIGMIFNKSSLDQNLLQKLSKLNLILQENQINLIEMLILVTSAKTNTTEKQKLYILFRCKNSSLAFFTLLSLFYKENLMDLLHNNGDYLLKKFSHACPEILIRLDPSEKITRFILKEISENCLLLNYKLTLYPTKKLTKQEMEIVLKHSNLLIDDLLINRNSNLGIITRFRLYIKLGLQKKDLRYYDYVIIYIYALYKTFFHDIKLYEYEYEYVDRLTVLNSDDVQPEISCQHNPNYREIFKKLGVIYGIY